MKKIFFAAVLIGFSITASAQYGYRDSNMIGLFGGINQFSLNTKNFDIKPEMGWNVGLSVRGNYYNDFDMVYAMQFSENDFSVATHNASFQAEDVKFKMPSAQISLMLSYKIVADHLSIELGPLIQINDKLHIKDEDKTNTIDGAGLKYTGLPVYAEDIIQVSHFNFYPTGGITAGIRNLRVNVQYQYGVTNFLSKVNSAETGVHGFKGTASIVSGNLIVYF